MILKEYLLKEIKSLEKLTEKELVEKRYKKFRVM